MGFWKWWGRWTSRISGDDLSVFHWLGSRPRFPSSVAGSGDVTLLTIYIILNDYDYIISIFIILIIIFKI